MTDEELQEIEDTAKGKALFNDAELLEWLKKDVIKLVSEIRRMKHLVDEEDWEIEETVYRSLTKPDAPDWAKG